MSKRGWILVQWLNKQRESTLILPSFGIVPVAAVSCEPDQIVSGLELFINFRNGSCRFARILRMSDNKQCLKIYKAAFRRNVSKFKELYELFVRIIVELRNLSENFASQTQTSDDSESESSSYDNESTEQTSDDRTSIRSSNDSDSMSVEQISHEETLDTKSEKGIASCDLNITPQKLVTDSPREFEKTQIVESSSSISATNVKNKSQGTQTDELLATLTLKMIEETELNLMRFFNNAMIVKLNKNMDARPVKSAERVALTESSDDQLMRSTPPKEVNLNKPTSIETYNRSAKQEGERFRPFEIQNREAQDTEYSESSLITEPGTPETISKATKMEMHDAPVVLDKDGQITGPSGIQHKESRNIEKIDFTQTTGSDMIPIGKGNARIPARVMASLNWNCYSYAAITIRLLDSVFPRYMLATHCLFEAMELADENKTAKRHLDQKLVDDIVDIVSSKCNVPKYRVENIIALKCKSEEEQLISSESKKDANVSQPYYWSESEDF